MLSFVFIKSINVGLNGARGIALAAILGPKSYGIFGTLIVLQQYLSYLALGMREGVAIRLAQLPGMPADVRTIYSSALFWGCCCGLVALAIFGFLHFGAGVVPGYFVWIGVLSLVSIVNEILININRYENKLIRIASMELVFQASALLIILFFSRDITIERAVLAMILGLLLGICGYFGTLRLAGWTAVSRSAIRELIQLGFLPGVFSAVVVIFNSLYVLVANWMQLDETIGLAVFGSNISVMLLFGLNTIAWALASRSMSRHFGTAARDDAAAARTELADIFFRFGVVAVVMIALSAQHVLGWVLPQYSGSALYILYFCLFQSYGLLLFSEMNFLNVNSRVRLVITGYVTVAASLAVLCLAGVEFIHFVRAGVVSYFLLSLGIAFYSRHLGFRGGAAWHRFAALSFPVTCLLAQVIAGEAGVAVVCTVALAGLLFLYGDRIREFVSARRWT